MNSDKNKWSNMRKRKNIEKYFLSILLFTEICLTVILGKTKAVKGQSVPDQLPQMEILLSDTSLDELCEGDKDIRYSGNQVIISSPDGRTLYTDQAVELKGRGNSSWKMPKRSFQIKFSQKTGLFGMTEARKWLLIANYADASLMRNRLIYDMAGEFMEFAPDSQFVDLWIDGEYQGNYLLCEKVEIGEGRVDLKNEKGILVELDNIYWYEEIQFQSQLSGTHFTLKDTVNEFYAEEAFSEFEDYVNSFESLLYAEEKDWEQISAMIDVDSFVKYYYIQELAENSDSCRTSVYMYKDGPDDLLHLGPVWDFDKAVGYSMRKKYGGDAAVSYVNNIEEYMGVGKDHTWWTELFKIPEFQDEARRIYQEQIQAVFSRADLFIEQYQEEIRVSANANFQLWDITEIPMSCDHEPYMYETWDEAAEGLRDWIGERIDFLNDT